MKSLVAEFAETVNTCLKVLFKNKAEKDSYQIKGTLLKDSQMQKNSRNLS